MVIREFYLNEENTDLYVEFSTRKDRDDFYRVLTLSRLDIEYYSPTIIEDLDDLDEDTIIDVLEEYIKHNGLPEEKIL
jgi:hypothetical protein